MPNKFLEHALISSFQFPNTTYSDYVSENPVVAAGSNSHQNSPPKYPSPWTEGTGDWDAAYAQARDFVSQLTLEEKVNLTTGTGWQLERCVGQTGSIPRLGFRAMCHQDSPLGIRYADLVSAFPAGVNVAATWDRGLAYARGVALGAENKAKGVDYYLGVCAISFRAKVAKSHMLTYDTACRRSPWKDS